jgi:hypothetical protein
MPGPQCISLRLQPFRRAPNNEEADLRSSAGHYQVDLAWKNDHLYARLWLLLNALRRVAPSPVAARARMRAAIEAQDESS